MNPPEAGTGARGGMDEQGDVAEQPYGQRDALLRRGRARGTSRAARRLPAISAFRFVQRPLPYGIGGGSGGGSGNFGMVGSRFGGT